MLNSTEIPKKNPYHSIRRKILLLFDDFPVDAGVVWDFPLSCDEWPCLMTAGRACILCHAMSDVPSIPGSPNLANLDMRLSINGGTPKSSILDILVLFPL